tara:strand:+ start:7995 stop:8309 length:315 start_codon:yes stop_codon:yes gene_type:complete
MFIKSSIKNIAMAAVLIGSLAACAAMSGRETAGEYLDDATITSKVMAQIINDPDLKKNQISVETLQNTVQLSGFVDSHKDVARAGELARGVKGVRSVENHLIVR